MSFSGNLISTDWHSTAEGRDMMSCLFTRNKQRLRTFGEIWDAFDLPNRERISDNVSSNH